MTEQHRDLVGGVLKALLLSGHIVVLGLLGLLVEQQQYEHHGLVAAAVPDTDPPVEFL